MPMDLQDIRAARERIREGVLVTPCQYSQALSDLCGCEVFAKLEFLQRTGSFKERGARNALLLLSDAARGRGVIAASAGNHALALAFHGRSLGIAVTVVMPRFAPLVKQANCRRFGANVILHGETFSEAKEEADRIAKDRGLTYIHGFDDPAIIAGQGTIGLELLEQAPELDAVIVPIGGGGLLAGVATVIKSLSPKTLVIGVEPQASASFSASVAAGAPTAVPIRPTIADGLAVSKVGANAFAIAKPLVDRIVTVQEQWIAISVVRLMEHEKSVVEGAGAAPLAALISGALPMLHGKRVALLLCGANIDLTLLDRLIDNALVFDHRITRLTAEISDRPGSLAKIAGLIGAVGAGIKQVTHDRMFSGSNMASVTVTFTVETRDQEHLAELTRHLRDSGVKLLDSPLHSE